MTDESCGGFSLEEIRSWFPMTRTRAYLFNGNVAPGAESVRTAVARALDTWAQGGDRVIALGKRAAEEAKASFARLIGAEPQSIASVPNTTTGIHLAALTVAPRAGANVVVHELSEHGSVYPWLQMRDRGVEVRRARASSGAVPISEIERLVDRDTAAISVTHVSMGSGFRFDLAALGRLAQAANAALIVDAAQSAGAIALDVRQTPVDFLVTPASKWLLGPLGAGFLYVQDAWVERAAPPMPGHGSVMDSRSVDLCQIRPHPSAQRFESGVNGALAWVGARAGLELLLRVGPTAIYDRIRELGDQLYAGLRALEPLGVKVWTPEDPACRAGIVAFDAPRRAELHADLEQRGIHVGHWQAHLRVDPGFYNTRAEIERLLLAIREFLTRNP